MDLSNVTAHLDTLLAASSYPAESNGLLVAGIQQVHKVAGTVNLSWSSLRTAAGQGVNLLFSHHAAWNSTDADIAQEKYEFARKAGLSVYVAHDSLDMHSQLGTAISLARTLDCEPVSFFADGLGVLALPPNDPSFESFVSHVQTTVNPDALAWPSHHSAGKVAIITGWGARPEWMNLAHIDGAGTFLSGEGIHFGKLYAFESGLNLILAGHYSTEAPAVKSVIRRLASELDIEAIFLADQKSSELF